MFFLNALLDFEIESKSDILQNEWEKEKDYYMFYIGTFKCEIKRTPGLRHLCGYIHLPKEHKYYGVNYSDLSFLSVHGGLTYSGKDKKEWRSVLSADLCRVRKILCASEHADKKLC